MSRTCSVYSSWVESFISSYSRWQLNFFSQREKESEYQFAFHFPSITHPKDQLLIICKQSQITWERELNNRHNHNARVIEGQRRLHFLSWWLPIRSSWEKLEIREKNTKSRLLYLQLHWLKDFQYALEQERVRLSFLMLSQ